MHLKAIITLIYGIVIAGGGIAGYVLAGSLPSLVSGGVLGLIIVIGAVLMFLGHAMGPTVALVGTIIVAGFFGFQLFRGLSTGGDVGRAAGILVLSLIELAVLYYFRAPPP